MSGYGSGVAMGVLGINPQPIGTLDELRRENLNPALIGSCAPSSPGVRGCQSYPNCIFRFKKFGGFRDFGAKNIGYFIQTHEGNKKEDEGSCHFFMQRLYDRMRAGERDRQDGKAGEIIEVIAQEGEIIHRQVTVNVNENPALPARYEKKTFTGPVSRFPRPGERQVVEYNTLLDDRRRAREAQDPDLQTGPSHRVVPGEVKQPPVMDVESVVATTAPARAPSAAPVLRKGRE
jgi:hypothetical protein